MPDKSRLILSLVFVLAVFGTVFAEKEDIVPFEVKEEPGIVYAVHINDRGQNEKLMLDVYSPIDTRSKSRAVIVFFHGGSFQNGNRETYYKLATELSQKGIVVISADYRLRTDASADWKDTVQNAVEDGAAAAEWIFKNTGKYSIDPGKIFIGGDSAGGYMALSIAYQGNYDHQKYKLPKICGVVDLFGGDIGDFIDKNSAPALIIHGDKDEMVQYTKSVTLSDRFKKAEVYYDFLTMTGAGHAYRNKYFNEIVKRIVSFTETAPRKI